MPNMTERSRAPPALHVPALPCPCGTGAPLPADFPALPCPCLLASLPAPLLLGWCKKKKGLHPCNPYFLSPVVSGLNSQKTKPIAEFCLLPQSYAFFPQYKEKGREFYFPSLCFLPPSAGCFYSFSFPRVVFFFPLRFSSSAFPASAKAIP